MKELISDNRVWFGESGENVPRRKSFLSEAKDGLTPHTLWRASNVGTTDSARKELTRLVEGGEIFETPKPVNLLRRILQISSSGGDVVMDFFAGSGTLAEAVWEEDMSQPKEKARSCILVQLPEPLEHPDFPNIAAFGIERLRATIQRISSGLNDHKMQQSDKLGFKVFKLTESNIKAWNADFEEIQKSLFDAIENIKPDRTQDDVLYELFLKFGLDLTTSVEERSIKGTRVFIVGAGALVVCLGNDIDLELVRGIAALKEELQPEIMRVVLKDSGFKNDVVKTNALQILNQAGIDDVKSL